MPTLRTQDTTSGTAHAVMVGSGAVLFTTVKDILYPLINISGFESVTSKVRLESKWKSKEVKQPGFV